MIQCPYPTVPAGAIIYPGGTFIDCGATWVVEGDYSIVRVHAIDPKKLAAGWKEYCKIEHPGDSKAQRICFRHHETH